MIIFLFSHMKNTGSDAANGSRDVFNSITGLEKFDNVVEIGGILKSYAVDAPLVSLIAIFNNTNDWIQSVDSNSTPDLVWSTTFTNFIKQTLNPKEQDDSTIDKSADDFLSMLSNNTMYTELQKWHLDNLGNVTEINKLWTTIAQIASLRTAGLQTIQNSVTNAKMLNSGFSAVYDSVFFVSQGKQMIKKSTDALQAGVAVTAGIHNLGSTRNIIAAAVASFYFLKDLVAFTSAANDVVKRLRLLPKDREDLKEVIRGMINPIVDKFMNGTAYKHVPAVFKDSLYNVLYEYVKTKWIDDIDISIEQLKTMLILDLIGVKDTVKMSYNHFTALFALLLHEGNTNRLKFNSDLKKTILLSSISVTLINKIWQHYRKSLPFPRRPIGVNKFNAAVGAVMFFYGILAHDPCYSIKLLALCKPKSVGYILGTILQKSTTDALNIGNEEYDIKITSSSEMPFDKFKMPLNKLYDAFQNPKNFEAVVLSIFNDLKGKTNELGNLVTLRPFQYHDDFDPVGKVFKVSNVPHIFKLPTTGTLHLQYTGSENTSRAELCSIYCEDGVIFKHFDQEEGTYVWYKSHINTGTQMEEIKRLSGTSLVDSLKDDIREGFLNGYFEYFDISKHKAQYAIYISDSLETEPKEIFKKAVQTVENIATENDADLKLVPYHINDASKCTIKHKLHHRFCPITAFVLAKHGFDMQGDAPELKNEVLKLKKKITNNEIINLILKSHPEWSESLFSEYENDDDYGGFLRQIDVKQLLEAMCAIEKCRIVLYSYNSLTDIDDYEPVRVFPEKSRRTGLGSTTVHMGYIPIFIPYWIDNHFIPFVKTTHEQDMKLMKPDLKAVEDEIKEHVNPTPRLKAIYNFISAGFKSNAPDPTDCEEYGDTLAKKAAEQKAAEQKAAEQKAAEQKVAEQKAAAQKAAAQKAAAQKAAAQKAANEMASATNNSIWATLRNIPFKRKTEESTNIVIKTEQSTKTVIEKEEHVVANDLTPFEKLSLEENKELMKKIITQVGEQVKMIFDRPAFDKVLEDKGSYSTVVNGQLMQRGNLIRQIVNNNPTKFEDPNTETYRTDFAADLDTFINSTQKKN